MLSASAKSFFRQRNILQNGVQFIFDWFGQHSQMLSMRLFSLSVSGVQLVAHS